MADQVRSLEDLKEALSDADSVEEATEGGVPSIDEEALPEPKIDEHGRAYGTGRRKKAIARVWVKPGSGRITINGKSEEDYFARPVLRMLLRQPMLAAERNDEFDVIATVRGSGLSGQAGAVRHGIARAMVNYEPALRAVLKPGSFMTRDSRAVERKKYGRKKARKSFQFSKR